MNTLFRRSASIAPSASRQTLPGLLRLIPAESFASSAISQLDHVNGLPPAKKGGAFEIRGRDFHFASPTRSSGFRASDTARVECTTDEKTSSSTEKEDDVEGLVILQLDVHRRIARQLEKRGITKLLPVQRACFEPAMEGRDLICRAKTGTGRTLAYGIPIMHKSVHYCYTECGREPKALVLTPTRERAKQVEREFNESSPMITLCAYDGLTIQAQIRKLDYSVDAVFGTPGDIIDLLKRSSAFRLQSVQFVVLGEADQTLAAGFEEAVETILEEEIYAHNQFMVFSATMPQALKNLTRKYLKDPVTIDLVSVQPQAAGGGYPSCGSSAYGAPSYGYGAANNGIRYGGYNVRAMEDPVADMVGLLVRMTILVLLPVAMLVVHLMLHRASGTIKLPQDMDHQVMVAVQATDQPLTGMLSRVVVDQLQHLLANHQMLPLLMETKVMVMEVGMVELMNHMVIKVGMVPSGVVEVVVQTAIRLVVQNMERVVGTWVPMTEATVM